VPVDAATGDVLLRLPALLSATARVITLAAAVPVRGPAAVDGVIYLASSWSNVFAFDARTGAQLWRYDPKVPREWAVNVCRGVRERQSADRKFRRRVRRARLRQSALLYIGTGNGSPWNQALRSPGGGDNLFLASMSLARTAKAEEDAKRAAVANAEPHAQ